MSTITREQLRERARAKVNSLEFSIAQTAFADLRSELEEELELARIALASLEAEPVAGEARFKEERHWSPCTAAHVAMVLANPSDWPNYEVRYLYTAPPAPSKAEPLAWLWSHRKHPSEVTLVRPEDDERAEGAYWSGWHCQPLTAQMISDNY